jgi:hypothetical protein
MLVHRAAGPCILFEPFNQIGALLDQRDNEVAGFAQNLPDFTRLVVVIYDSISTIIKHNLSSTYPTYTTLFLQHLEFLGSGQTVPTYAVSAWLTLMPMSGFIKAAFVLALNCW